MAYGENSMIKKLIFWGLLMIFIAVFHIKGQAEEIYEDYNFDDLDIIMSEETNGEYSFTDMIGELFSGDNGIIYNVINMIKKSIVSEFEYNKDSIIKIIALVICMALLSNILVVFNNNNYSDTGFFIVYLILINTLFGVFLTMTKIAIAFIGTIVNFMKCLIPAFFLAIGVSNGYTTSTGLCAVTLTVLTVLEIIISKVLLPVINVYVAISLVTSLQKENNMSKIGESLSNFVNWSVKMMITAVLGLNVIESMILPSADAVKNKGVTHIVSMIPGVGNSLSGAANLVLSSGEIIKNTIGGTALVALVIIAAIPIVKLLVFMGMYKLLGIIVQPISDKRVIEAIDVVVNASRMLYRISISSVIMLGASIAIICVFTK